MDSEESTKYIDCWEEYLRDEGTLREYNIPAGGYKSFNQFFTRTFKDIDQSRPISEPDNDSILTSSADSEINFIQTELTLSTDIPVKTTKINVLDLLNQSPYASNFEGGTAVSCVLMPNDYHRYHSPVSGTIVESAIVDGIYNGIKDGEHWFNQGNIGESTTNFSIFENFHRGYFIIQTENNGFVAVIPVGLNTISSVVFEDSALVPPPKKGKKPKKKNWKPVKKGGEIGHFAYGGSLNILLFEPGVFGSVSILMGQRIGELGSPAT
jgi:phosphatidylserine decarboxylase